MSTLGPKFGHFGARIPNLLEKSSPGVVGNVWKPEIKSKNSFVDFSDFVFEVCSSTVRLNDGSSDRKFDRNLLESRVQFPQMEAPNGLRENRALLTNNEQKVNVRAACLAAVRG